MKQIIIININEEKLVLRISEKFYEYLKTLDNKKRKNVIARELIDYRIEKYTYWFSEYQIKKINVFADGDVHENCYKVEL